MRVFLTFAIIITISLDLFAQSEKPINKGNLIIGGSTSISYIGNKSGISDEYYSTAFSASLSPSASYFIVDKLAVGLSISSSYLDNNGRKYYSLGVGPMLSCYLENGLLFGISTTASLGESINEYDDKNYYISLSPFVGFSWFINSKISIEPRISYSYQKNRSDVGTDPIFGIQNRVHFSIGMTKFL